MTADWIPVGEKDPPAYVRVLTWVSVGGWVTTYEARCDSWHPKKGWLSEQDPVNGFDSVTHWRLMPAGPQEGKAS